MSEGEYLYLKCPCKECGNNIEFPANILRQTITCPHCGQWTELLIEFKAVNKKRDWGSFILIGGLSVGVLLAITAGFYFNLFRPLPQGEAKAAPAKTVSAIVAKTVPKSIPVAPTLAVITNNVLPSIATQEIAQVDVVKRPKSPDDLKTGGVKLEKTPGNSLVYVVGTLKNDSAYQRFGVTVELNLTNKTGELIGTTKDYKDVIEPHQSWSFRALSPIPKAQGAKVSAIKEEP